jgi:hypothetical protein
MWVIQGDILVSLPDGAPVPAGSTQAALPPGFHENPHGFTVQDGAVVPFERPIREPLLQLTQSEIARIKAAIEAGLL